MHYFALFSTWVIPCFILTILLIATWKRAPTYELFVEGGKEGIDMAFTLLPYLLGMVVSIAIFRSSGALDAGLALIAPLAMKIGIPNEIIPLAMIRPISGTAALSMTAEITKIYGPDSFLGRLAATMQGSTDTTLYVIMVYFGAVKIKKIKYALTVGLLADLVAIIATIIIVTIVFG